jgi:hypothetical protein
MLAIRTYRYRLCRTFGPGPTATFIMLNPSTADAERDDPTIRKCVGFCQRWGCGTLRVVNLFGVRAASPREMMKTDDPIGSDNETAIVEAIENLRHEDQGEPSPVICAWGTHGGFMGRDLEIMRWLGTNSSLQPMCLGITKEGYAKHPLYVPYDAPLTPYAGRQ